MKVIKVICKNNARPCVSVAVIYFLCDAVHCRVSAAIASVAGLLKGKTRTAQGSDPMASVSL